ncbi:MAG: tetratricopeptide repeat protein [Verrucomicrobiota bacterium]
MKIRKIAAITVLVFSSFAASNVAPSKSELEAMYSKAFRAFDANNFAEALKQLDDIDTRQPDVAESHNLRGVILMRQGVYDKAETALQEAVRIDPKFWNARFNLAEIPFLKKDWPEARDRFQKLLTTNVSDLEGEAAQLIQYKILLTYLLEGKENMVDSILAKFELSPDTPAVHYANAAIAFQRNNSKEAKDWMTAAEKNFSPQLNKLFAESLYEVGWMEKPAGQARASIPLTTAAERVEKTKAFARSRFEQAQQAFQQRDLTAARKFIDETDAAEPNQPTTLNLRGEILMEQKEFDDAEATLKKAAKIDPKFREAQYNLAQIPFKKKDYAAARDRFETLLKQTPGGDKNQASQILKFKIFMTLLLEGKDSRAQKMMEQFQFTGDTPALYYAQAAWEFRHNNPNKASDWVTSAKKIYSSPLNNVFADSFYDLGWMQTPAIAAGPAPAAEAATVMSAQTEASPAIEPSPIPGTALAANKQAKESKAEQKIESKPESLASSSPAASPLVSWKEGATSQTTESPALGLNLGGPSAAGTPATPEEVPSVPAPTLSPMVETTPAAAEAPPATSVAALASPAEQSAVAESNPAEQSAPPVASTPATTLAPARVDVSQTAVSATNQMTAPRTLLIVGSLLAATFLFAWVIIPALTRRGMIQVPIMRAASAAGPSVGSLPIAPSENRPAVAKRLSGGPRQVSLQLKASEPSLRRSVLPSGKAARAVGTPVATEPAAYRMPEPVVLREPEPIFHAPEPAEVPEIDEPITATEDPVVESVGPIMESVGPIVEQQFEAAWPTSSDVPESNGWMPETPVAAEFDPSPMVESESFVEPVMETESFTEAMVEAESMVDAEPMFESPAVEQELEPIGQGQPIPYQMPAWTEPSAPEPLVDTPFFDTNIISTESSLEVEQTITPVTMPEPIQIPTARTPAAGGMPQPAGAMHTAVQLTFTFEIASMQLTPAFKMGALQVRPTSKIVTMRLAPSQQPQPGMNLQVTFEIGKIQPAGGALGSIRLTPTQAQRPAATGSPSFTVAGLQLVNFEPAPVQLTPSGQAASVLVTAPFQIATVEFSPSFEIASIVLNSNSKQVLVQLPGPAPTGADGAPMFEIANLQLTGSGDIGMMQLNLAAHGPRRS